MVIEIITSHMAMQRFTTIHFMLTETCSQKHAHRNPKLVLQVVLQVVSYRVTELILSTMSHYDIY